MVVARGPAGRARKNELEVKLRQLKVEETDRWRRNCGSQRPLV